MELDAFVLRRLEEPRHARGGRHDVECEPLCLQRMGRHTVHLPPIQHLLLRKGGIHEERGRFNRSTPSSGSIQRIFIKRRTTFDPMRRPLLEPIAGEAPFPGSVKLALYAVVHEVLQITDESLLPRLAKLQILAEQVLSEAISLSASGVVCASRADLWSSGADFIGRIAAFRRLSHVGRPGRGTEHRGFDPRRERRGAHGDGVEAIWPGEARNPNDEGMT